MEKYAEIIAELLGINNPVFRASCYAGIEICWHAGNGNFRYITFVDGGHQFCYTKFDPSDLPGDWKKVDYWFLYL